MTGIFPVIVRSELKSRGHRLDRSKLKQITAKKKKKKKKNEHAVILRCMVLALTSRYSTGSFSVWSRALSPEGLGERVTACRKEDGDELLCGSVS